MTTSINSEAQNYKKMNKKQKETQNNIDAYQSGESSEIILSKPFISRQATIESRQK